MVTQHCLVVWSGGSSYITVFYPLFKSEEGKIMKWKAEKVPVASHGLAVKRLEEQQQHVSLFGPQSSGSNNWKQKKRKKERKEWAATVLTIDLLTPIDLWQVPSPVWLQTVFIWRCGKWGFIFYIFGGPLVLTAVTTWRCVYLLYITSNVTPRFFFSATQFCWGNFWGVGVGAVYLWASLLSWCRDAADSDLAGVADLLSLH